MRRILYVPVFALLFACNNSKKEKETTATDTTKAQSETSTNDVSTPASGSATVSYSVNDTVRNISGSVLVSKDKDKLSPGNDYFSIVTANGPNEESFVINFVFALKPGTYPVVGLSLSRTNQVFGGILGGKPAITNYKVNLTQCEDLGSNNIGGHKWRISGNVEGEVTIDAMGIMKMDKSHPENVKVNKISFSNLTFDDNWEALMEEGMKKLQEGK